MNRVITSLLLMSLLLAAPTLYAQQFKRFGKYEVHYNALTTDQLPAAVAQGYGITRSPSRGMVNITVLEMASPDATGPATGTPIHADVTVAAVNLTGQLREIPMRVITEPGDAVYYIGDFPVHNLETYTFKVAVSVDAEAEPFELEFRQQFFTE